MLLELNEVSKRFGGVAALTGITFSVKEGEVYGVIGPNGAGKTTLFNLITGVFQCRKVKSSLTACPLLALNLTVQLKWG